MKNLLLFLLLPVMLAANARVVLLIGSASQETGGRKTTLKTGDSVPLASTVSTEAKSTVILELPAGDRIKLNPVTSVRLDSLSAKDATGRTEINLITGSVFSRVVKKNRDYLIRSPLAVAGVRGTVFFVAHDTNAAQPRTWVCVHEGRVQAENQKGRADIPAGKGVELGRDSVSEVAEYEWTKALNWKFADSKTEDVADRSIFSSGEYGERILRQRYD